MAAPKKLASKGGKKRKGQRTSSCRSLSNWLKKNCRKDELAKIKNENGLFILCKAYKDQITDELFNFSISSIKPLEITFEEVIAKNKTRSKTTSFALVYEHFRGWKK
jgi:hypothetical protein